MVLCLDTWVAAVGIKGKEIQSAAVWKVDCEPIVAMMRARPQPIGIVLDSIRVFHLPRVLKLNENDTVATHQPLTWAVGVLM